MAFTIISHGPRQIRLTSDDGHRFLFDVVAGHRSRALIVTGIDWCAGCAPDDSSAILDGASHFAAVFAEDFGLL